MKRHLPRIIAWVFVLAFGIYAFYHLERFEIEKGTLGNGQTQEDVQYPQETIDRLKNLDQYSLAAETDRLGLYIEPATSSVAVKDKQTGALWMSASNIPDEVIGGSQLLRNSVKAPVNFTYTDFSRPIHEIISSNSISSVPKLQYEDIADGKRVIYSFEKLGIEFAVEYTLKDDLLDVFIPASRIKEKTQNLLVSVEPLPNLGAASDEDDGYMFFPDGSGSIAYFKEVHPQYLTKYSAMVYGSEDIFKNTNQPPENAYLPVFGVHKNGDGYVAYVAEGEYEAKINYYPSGYTINVNRISSEFTYRRMYDAAVRRGEFVNRVEEKMTANDHRLQYVFLPKESADYSGMANKYREYLVESGKLHKKIGDAKEIPAAVDLFMGIEEKRVLGDRFIKATTYEQAKQFIKDMKDQGVQSLSISLVGWMHNGVDDLPDDHRAAAELGGAAKLKELTKFAKDNGVELYLNYNNAMGFGENLRLTKTLDVMKTPSRMPLENVFIEMLMLNAARAKEKFDGGAAETIAGYGPSGIDFAAYGEMAVADYNEWHPLTREGTVRTWLDMMQESREQNGKVAVRGGNQYVLSIADRILDIPLRDTGYMYADEAVPFFQMVVHGYVPYSGDIPLNIHYNQRELFLKWVEYGSMPYYFLTRNNPEEFRFTHYDDLFSSTMKQWSPVLVEQYKQINEKLGHTWGLTITGHKILQRNVYETTYEDGTKVIVNYNTTAYSSGALTVNGMDYAVIQGGNAQ
ncbi:DUF5696 domain-containing protein [Paenibacillus thermotolerans]|uniref:DUF5696 domain-containing protein n=1 Tax=Paenibacillus thermotolerans TaxID=3027807 RepID=UPI0023679AA6|nr:MULTISPECIES: DUF5696 domain-containing protein [unclassified Paenibacillus]